ncbi:hypothetical protein M0G74_02410 [Microbulbifer sp. CAU 1566]|uniref:hypothetical protein n=1 Tax=Microbulbifer sp. CAU 1566 TaxID=2933269 RepID=UPI002003A180|nr:hypothetical protein [Microbulbifer sp. CAU 1566]MCK7596118.1 hypothetical protein [Microbulbifer sp. CAU 1566]
MDEYLEKNNTHPSDSLATDQYRRKFGGDWRYNEVIGFLRFYQYGKNKIRCGYWETDAKKKSRTPKKRFIKISDSYCDEPFSASAPNPDLAQTMRSAVDHCEARLKAKKRVLDREIFDSLVDHIDWQTLLN